MEIHIQTNDAETVVSLTGRLDTLTSPDLSDALQALDASARLVLDFSNLSYLSSAGLRVLLSAQKRANSASGSLCIRNVNESVLDVFEITGFNDVLTIE